MFPSASIGEGAGTKAPSSTAGTPPLGESGSLLTAAGQSESINLKENPKLKVVILCPEMGDVKVFFRES